MNVINFFSFLCSRPNTNAKIEARIINIQQILPVRLKYAEYLFIDKAGNAPKYWKYR